MDIDNRFFYYDTLAAVKQKAFAGCLAITDITSGLVNWKEVRTADGDAVYDFWGFVVAKDKTKYLFPVKQAELITGKINMESKFPIRATKTRIVSYEKNGYHMIESCVPVLIPPKATLSFRALVNTLACFKNSNPIHYRLYWFIVLASVLDRANFRVSTPAGFGKNSAVNIVNSLNMSAGTIENPSFAKLKERAYRLKLLVLNEVIDIPKAEWRPIEQFLLACGDMSPQFTNNTRSHKGMEEVIDISRLSLLLTYNDIDHYSDPKEYIDVIAKTAVLDRFVPLRLTGRMQEDYNSIKGIDITALGERHLPQYKELVSNLVYYRENMQKHIKPFNDSKLAYFSERWRLSIHRLLKIISAYCESQEEYDLWVEIINNAHADYKNMKPYPTLIEKLKKKMGTTDFEREMVEIRQLNTFSEKNAYIEALLKGNKPISEAEWKL